MRERKFLRKNVDFINPWRDLYSMVFRFSKNYVKISTHVSYLFIILSPQSYFHFAYKLAFIYIFTGELSALCVCM